MFTLTGKLWATLVLAAALAIGVTAAPTHVGSTNDIEARVFGDGGWINPSKGKGKDGKARQAGEIWAIETHKQNDPTHPAVAAGNTANVHDTWHSTQGGPQHMTVKYTKPGGDHATTLHIDKAGGQIKGNDMGYQPKSTAPTPHNSPSTSKKN